MRSTSRATSHKRVTVDAKFEGSITSQGIKYVIFSFLEKKIETFFSGTPRGIKLNLYQILRSTALWSCEKI